MKSKKWLLPLVAMVALLAIGTAGAAGSESFTDPPGDSGLAPDVVGLDVSNDDKGLLTFALKFGNRTSLTGDDAVLVFLMTGKSEYLIVADWSDRSYSLGRWNGNDYDFDVPHDTLLTRDGMTFWINRSELDDAATLLIHTATLAGWDGQHYQHSDDAPDAIAGGVAVWPYVLTFPPELRSVKPTFAPLKPRAGKRFAVSGARVVLGTGETVRAESVTCSARLAGKALRLAGRCAWNVPPSAKGKRLTVTVKVSYHGATRSAGPFAFTVGR
jgi:hypothetical protein